MDATERRYFIIKPNEKRKSFSLVCYTLKDRKTRVYQPIQPTLKDRVDSINSEFLSGTIQLHEALLLIQDLIGREYKKANVKHMVLKNSVLSDVNQKAFNSFWSTEYSTRYLQDEKSAKYDIQKSIRLIEPLSLYTATAQEIQTKLKSSGVTVAEIRRATDRLNQLMRFLGRGFVLQKPKPGVHKVMHLKIDEFKRVLNLIDTPECKLLAVTLFASGLRMGEAMALTVDDVFNGQINVSKQLSKEGETRLPKRDKTGSSVFLPEFKKEVIAWTKIENKPDFRFRLLDEMQSACKRLWPKDRTKWITPHDLRHSHAIHLLVCGANLTQVALNLRNRVDVCQKYYTGYAHSEGTADALKRLISS